MIKRILLLGIVMLNSVLTTHAQRSLVDSVQKELQRNNLADTLRAKSMVYLAMYTEPLNAVQSHQLYRQALTFSLEKKLYYYAGMALRYEAGLYSVESKWDLQRRNLYQALAYFNKSGHTADAEKEIGIIYTDLGDYYRHVNLYDSAIAVYMRGICILEKTEGGDLTKSYLNLSLIYESMDMTDKQKQYLDKGLAAAKRSGNRSSLFSGYLLQVHYWSKIKQNGRSKKYLDSAGLYFNESYSFGEIQSFYALSGYLHQQASQYDSAVHYYTVGYGYAKRHNSRFNMIEAQNQIAYNYSLQKRYKDAEPLLKEALQMAIADSDKLAMREGYGLLNNIYSETGRYKEAEEMLWNYLDIDALIMAENKKKFILNLEKKYETEKKEDQIKIQQATIRQKNTLNYILFGGAGALLVILILGYRNYRHRQKGQQQRITELETEKQLAATEAVLKGEEQERARMAKDLHDGLGGMLSGIRHSFSTVKGNLIMTPDNLQVFERSMDMLDSSIKEMRRVAHNMMPEALLRFGLDTALRDFCNDIDQSGALQLRYQSIGIEGIQPGETIAIAVFRIVQELLSNIIKHAAAQHVIVQLSKTGNVLAIAVEDDGSGFDVHTLSTTKGIGWHNIQNRVDFLKGKLDISSNEKEGTSVLIELPV